MRKLCPESPDVDVIKKTANALSLGPSFSNSGKIENGITFNWFRPIVWWPRFKTQTWQSFFKSNDWNYTNEENALYPDNRSNSKIRKLWSLKDTHMDKGGILFRQWFSLPESVRK